MLPGVYPTNLAVDDMPTKMCWVNASGCGSKLGHTNGWWPILKITNPSVVWVRPKFDPQSEYFSVA